MKHYLDVYQLLDNFPTDEDILYELACDEAIISGKDVSINHIKHILSFKVGLDELETLLNSLIKQNFIKNVKKQKTTSYKLLTHPWS